MKKLHPAPPPRRARASARALAREPLAWGGAIAVVIVGAAGAAAGAIVAGPAVLALTAATCVAARRPAVRRYMDARRRRERARRRQDARELRLEDAGVDRDGLMCLARLSDHVARCDPARAEALELEQLIDRYTDAAVALARLRRVMAETDIGRLQRLHAVLDPRSSHGALVARRLSFWTECRERCRALEVELVTIHELFLLVAQQAVAGAGAPVTDGAEIEDRLARLDARGEL